MSTTQTALLIGSAPLLARLEQQLDLLADRPVSIGWVTTEQDPVADGPVVGHVDELEAVVARRRPGIALVCLPAVMHDLVTRIRTRLRRLDVPDRFVPTLEDLVAGVGPRTVLEIDLAALLDRPARTIDRESIRSVVEGSRVLITGAGGSIGSELARIVADHAPAELALMERSENALFEIDRQIARRHPDLARRPVLHDIVDAERTTSLCTTLQPDVVLHAAAHKHVPMMEIHPGAAVDNNLFGTRAIADAAHAAGARRFVMISTDKAVNPTSVMGATKRLAEFYVQDIQRRTSMACSMVRFGNVLGSSGSVLDVWSRQLADGGPITVTDPRMTRYFMTIPEAAGLVLESAALLDPSAPHGEVFLLDMGDPVRIVDMAERFIRMHGLVPRLGADAAAGATGEMRVVYTGARPGEKLFEELAARGEHLQPTRHPDIHVWLVPTPDPARMGEILGRLDPARRPSDKAALTQTIRDLVPEMSRPLAA